MPIYEFYCSRCHRIYSFLSRGVNTAAAPACPQCGQEALARRVSAFAISKGRKEEPAGGPEGAPDFDEEKMMKALEAMGPEAESMDENDPRQAASMMRKLFQTTGMPVAAEMEEALRRMEAGEDPEKIEEELGDVLETADPFAMSEDQKGSAKDRVAVGLRRRLAAPTVDQTLYEM